MTRTVEQNLVSILALGHHATIDVMRRIPDGSWFADHKAGKAYDVVIEAFRRQGAVDLTTLHAPFKAHGLEDYFINTVVTGEMPMIDAVKLADLIVEAKAMREVRILGKALETSDATEDPREVLSKLSARVVELQGLFQGDNVVSSERAVQEAVERTEAMWRGDRKTDVQWGFRDLDMVTGGIDAGELGIVAALEKSGKTTLALQTIEHNAERGIPCLFFSSEMSRIQLVTRIALYRARITYVSYRKNLLRDEERERFYREMERIEKLPIFIRDGVFSMLDVAAETQRHMNRGVKLVAVDYVQRITPLDRKGQTREQEIADISRRLKDLAQSNHIPVIALSQVNEDLRARESRAIEQDMDKLILLNRGDGESVAEVKIRQRMGASGALGEVKLHYDTEFGMWGNHAEERTTPPVVAGRDDLRLEF